MSPTTARLTRRGPAGAYSECSSITVCDAARVTSERWRALTEWPLIGVAVVFLVVFSWAVIGDVRGEEAFRANVLLWLCWAAFAVDYVVRLVLAEQRGRWFVRHLPDLALVALPMLRPLRLLRLIILLAAFQRLAGRTMRGRVLIYVVGSTVGLVYLCSLAMLEVERHDPASKIHSFGEAVWWAFATITTVGYGDITPVTFEGRLIAVVLMIGGVALLGTVTAALASWLVERVGVETREAVQDEADTREAEESRRERAADERMTARLEALAAEVAALRSELAGRPESTPQPNGSCPRTP